MMLSTVIAIPGRSPFAILSTSEEVVMQEGHKWDAGLGWLEHLYGKRFVVVSPAKFLPLDIEVYVYTERKLITGKLVANIDKCIVIDDKGGRLTF